MKPCELTAPTRVLMVLNALGCSYWLFQARTPLQAWAWLVFSLAAWFTSIRYVVTPAAHSWAYLVVRETGELARMCDACGKVQRNRPRSELP